MDRFTLLLVLFSVVHGAFSTGNLEVLYSPDAITLKDTSEPLLNSDLSKFVSLCLAYSTEKPSNWNGFYGYKSFANIPLSVVTFHVPLTLRSIATQVYALDDDSDIEDQHSVISSLMSSKYDNSFSEKVALFQKKGDSLDDQIKSINSFLSQLQELKAKNTLPQRLSLWFDFASDSKIDEKSALKFEQQIQEAVAKLRNVLDGKVVIISIENLDLKPLKRASRQATPPESQDINLAYAFDADYHTAFATIGFTTVLLLLTVFGVSVAMWNIDPGRDSIIYRLTSQKMKKDQ